MAEIAPQTMLTDGISAAYRAGRDRIAEAPDVEEIFSGQSDGRSASPSFFVTSGKAFLSNPTLSHEVFGPIGLLVKVNDLQEMRRIAQALEGQLTCTLMMDDSDTDAAQKLVPILERKAGRLLVNGYPTGVEVCDAMVHGGPYPASTNFGATSVGTLAIRRFLRPVCYQNMPNALLPADFETA